ncbi:MAG: hypothetical protein NDJ89_07260 [Oligoflexia bacterium]|nr:hypothetical protein [Oligoflexia bacterium]
MRHSGRTSVLLVLLLLAPVAARCAEESATSLAEAGVPLSGIRRSSATYFARLNGPALEGAPGGGYNVYAGSPWPVQLYQSLTYSYRLDRLTTVGVELSSAKGLVRDVPDSFGAPVATEWVIFHPALQLNRASLGESEQLAFYGLAQLFVPTSRFAREELRTLASVSLQPGFRLKALSGRWSGGMNTRLQATFYGSTPVTDYWKRERLLFAAGHWLNFGLSPRLQLATSSHFDFNLETTGDRRSETGRGSDDRAEAQLNYFPFSNGSSFGVFLTCSLSSFSARTSFAGAQLTVNF